MRDLEATEDAGWRPWDVISVAAAGDRDLAGADHLYEAVRADHLLEWPDPVG